MKLPENIQLTAAPERLLIQARGLGCHLAVIRCLICDTAREAGFPEDQVAQIELAVDEACSNVIAHAYGGDQHWHGQAEGSEIRIAIRPEVDRLVIEITDHGRRFDSASYQPKDLQGLMLEGRSAGYGIPIMHRCMDEVGYHSDGNAANTLRLVKYIKPRPRDGASPGADHPPAP